MPPTTPPGWYPDPYRRVAARWWDGAWWTAWESDGRLHWIGTPPEPLRAPTQRDVAALAFVRQVFLPEAQRRGAVGEAQAAGLARLADELVASVGGPRVATVAAPVGPAAPPTARPIARPPAPVPVPAPAPQPAGFAPPTPAPPTATAPGAPATPPPPGYGLATPPGHAPAGPPRRPGRLATWWRTSRLRLDTDLTVHGLTYLGVLLLFVGVFGLVAFAFGDVEPWLRPVAELAVAVVPFVAAALLARSGARFVARAMVAVGGLILPVMVVTATVDGFGFPPDLRGAALPVGSGVAVAAVGVAYAVGVARRPGSPLRAIWAPVLWFAAGMAAIGLGRPVPRGQDVATPGSAQVAVIALALLTTVWWASRVAARAPERADDGAGEAAGDSVGAATRAADDAEPRGAAALATGVLTAAPAGLVVATMLALVAGLAEGWPVLPFLVTAPALALALACLPRFGVGADGVLAGAWGLVVLRAATVDVPTPWLTEHLASPGTALSARPVLLLGALVAGVGLLELLARRRPSGSPAFAAVGWAVAALAVGCAAVPDGGWWALGGAVALAGRAVVRRLRPPALPGAAAALDAVAAVAPVAAVVAVWVLAGGPVAAVVLAGLAVAVAPLARGRLRRSPDDVLWPFWWGGAVAVAVSAAVVLAGDGALDAPGGLDRVVVPVVLALAVAALAAGPTPAYVLVPLATPLVWGLWASVVVAAWWDRPTLVAGFAALGLGAVVAAHVRPSASGEAPGRGARPASGATGLLLAGAGYATGLLALVTALGDPAWTAATLGAATFGWLVTAVAGDLGRSPVGGALASGHARPLPWALVLLGAPLTAWAALTGADVLTAEDPWWGAPFLVAAVVWAAGTRVVPGASVATLRPALTWCGLPLALAALVLAPAPAAGRWAFAAALAALVAVGPLVRDRHPALTWLSWAGVVPLVGVAAWTGWAAARDLGGTALTVATLVGAGGLLALGALAVDRPDQRHPRLLPRRAAAVPPSSVGQVALVAGVAAIPSVTDAGVAGWLLVAAALLVGAVAVLGGIGVVGTGAALLAWLGVRVLLGALYAGAWADVGVAAMLLGAALAASLVAWTGPRWARWPLPLALGADVPAVVALAVAGPGERSGVFVAVGALAIAVAVRVRRWRVASETLATTGSLLVLLGAAWAGRLWAAAALAALSAGHTGLAATVERGTWRTARQWVGAALAVPAVLLLVAEVAAGDPQRVVDATGVVAGLAAVAVVGAAAGRVLDRTWAVAWGSVWAATGAAMGLAFLPTTDVGVTGLVQVSWWQVATWALLAVAAELAARVAPSVAPVWRVVGVVPALVAVLVGLQVAAAETAVRVAVLAAVSVGAAAPVVVRRLPGGREAGRPPAPAGTDVPAGASPGLVRDARWLVLGVGALVLAAGLALAGDVPGRSGVPRAALVAAVLAVAAVEAGAYGVVLRVLGLRLAAPLVAWLAWVVYAADAVGGVVAWYTVPVGLALAAVVEVWRADRRGRGLSPREPGLVALDLAGIGFLVVASFVAAFTQSVVHALVAAGLGVLVFLWGVVSRVRRRLLAGAGIVLAAVVVAVVLPLVALVPAWGGAALWVLVAVVGLVVVLAATLLERGRAMVRGGRARLLELTAGWE